MSDTKRLRDLWESMVLTSSLGLNDRDNSRAQFDLALRSLEEQLGTYREALEEIDRYAMRSEGGSVVGAGRLARAALASSPASSPYPSRFGSSLYDHDPATEVVDLDAGRKVCVHCGGDAHPDECGEPDPASEPYPARFGSSLYDKGEQNQESEQEGA